MSGLSPVSPYLLQAPKPRPKWLPGDQLVWNALVLAVNWADGWIYTLKVDPTRAAEAEMAVGTLLEQGHKFRLSSPADQPA